MPFAQSASIRSHNWKINLIKKQPKIEVLLSRRKGDFKLYTMSQTRQKVHWVIKGLLKVKLGFVLPKTVISVIFLIFS